MDSEHVIIYRVATKTENTAFGTKLTAILWIV